MKFYLTIGSLVLLLGTLIFVAYKTYKLGKIIGKEEANEDENKRLAEMAEKMYDTNPNANFHIRNSKLWFQ